MGGTIEDHALIGDMQSAALVDRDGTIDWLCWPRFDSDACFAELLGDERHGAWRFTPRGEVRARRRRYRGDTLVLETELVTAEGAIRIVDTMPPRGHAPDLARIVEGLEGEVEVRMELAARFGYGRRRPWIQWDHGHVRLTSAPDALALWSDVPLHEHDGNVVAELRLRAGEHAGFLLEWHPAHEPVAPSRNPREVVADTEAWWREWTGRCAYAGPWREAVVRSLITLKALTYRPTGGIVAAPTTSLPEALGGVRNWDYRYCWLRDATLTLYALLAGGYDAEARAFADWIARAARGEPWRIQVLYGVAGERRLTELELPWLPGHADSRPVRIGNAASEQLQLDIYGELIDCLHHARRGARPEDPDIWELQRGLVEHLATVWREPDEGIWEVRGPRRHFTHSKVMAWVAFDRMIRDAERHGLAGPVARWRALRDEIHRDVCANAVDPARGVFTQAYGAPHLDAAVLLLPAVGFVPADDPRMRRTIEAIRRELCEDGFVLRYDSAAADDGLPAGEGAFLPCSFWLADALHLIGDERAAHALFERLLDLRNDVGLLSEEIDPRTGRMLGNFPQAFSHVALVDSARNLSDGHGPADRRSRD